ncbi:MAG: efflux RND transporter periplasmic adaptor subunit [Alphaproteobacteria bacterium]
MKRSLIQVLAVVGLLGGAAAISFFLVWTKPEAATKAPEEREWVVDVINVTRSDLQPTLRLTGRIVAAKDAELRPLAVGRIIEIGPNFYAGGKVAKGDLLVAIDPFEYEAELADAGAAIDESKGSIAETQAEINSNRALIGFDREQEKLRKKDLDRKKRLEGRGVISAKSMDDARIAYISARQARVTRTQAIERLKAQAARLRASLTRAKVRLRRAERNMQETRLTAPFEGILVDVSASIGKRVGASDRIARIVDSEHLEALFHMSDAQFGRLAGAGGVKGRPAKIIWRAGDSAIRLDATLERIQGEFDAASGGVWVYAPIQMKQNMAGLRPGAFVEAETPDVLYGNVVRLPEAAVHDGVRVYIVRDGRLDERTIEILGRERGDLIVSGDLADGDHVVITRIPEIGPGLKARARDEAAS